MNTHRISRFQMSAVVIVVLLLMAALALLPVATSLASASLPYLPTHELNTRDIVNAFHSAINSDNADALLNLFAEDAIVIESGSVTLGKEPIRHWALYSRQMSGLRLELLKFMVDGVKVTWLDKAYKESEAGHSEYILQWEAVIRDGKIQSLTVMPRFRPDLK